MESNQDISAFDQPYIREMHMRDSFGTDSEDRGDLLVASKSDARGHGPFKEQKINAVQGFLGSVSRGASSSMAAPREHQDVLNEEMKAAQSQLKPSLTGVKRQDALFDSLLPTRCQSNSLNPMMKSMPQVSSSPYLSSLSMLLGNFVSHDFVPSTRTN